MQTAVKLPVTESALFQRINRAFQKEGGDRASTLHKTRGDSGDLGAYYIIGSNNVVVATHVDLLDLAQEQGVIAEYEQLQGAVVEEEQGSSATGAGLPPLDTSNVPGGRQP